MGIADSCPPESLTKLQKYNPRGWKYLQTPYLLTHMPGMKYLITSLVACGSCVFTAAQDRITFNYNENKEFSKYWKPSAKQNEWDTVSFAIGRVPYYTEYVYTGYMNNNLFNGPGKVSSNKMSYTGEWKDGRPHGMGHLVQKGPLVDRVEFKGRFVEGKPVNGLYFIVARNKKPTTFYSGDVMYANGKIYWHGYGQVLRMDIGDWDNLGVPGSFHAGQFYHGSATGFGITHTTTMDRVLSNLSTALVLADRVIKVFDILPLRTDHLLGGDFIPATGDNRLTGLLPEYASVRKLNFPIDSTASYSGTAVRNEPYGLGMVKYSDGFIDFGIWKEGKKIEVKELLEALLPQAALLEPWERQELIWQPSYIAKTKNKPETYKWDWEKTNVVYYASRNEKGLPVGWGYKIVKNQYSPVQGGYFLGVEPKKGDFGATPLFIQVPENLHKILSPALYSGFGYVDYSEKQNSFMDNSGYWVLIPYNDTITGRNPEKRVYRQGDYRARYDQVAYTDHRFFRDEVTALLKSDIERKKGESQAFRNLPQLKLTKVTINRSRPAMSYVTDGKITVNAEAVRSSELKKHDYVLHNDRFKRITEIFYTYILLEDHSTLTKTGAETYTAIRNYQINYQEQDWVCPACKGTGGSKSDSKVNIVSGSKTEVNHTTSQTATVTIKPVYTQIGGLSGFVNCTECKGDGIRKVKITQTEIVR